MKTAAVIGAGAAGLSCALALAEGGRAVTLIEAEDRVGGRIGSRRVGPYIVETGPASLAEGWEGLLPFISKIGLDRDLVISDDRATKRYVYHGGKLRTAPGKPPELIGSDILPFAAKLRMLAEPLIPRGSDPDESIGSFARRRLGRDFAELLVDAIVSGIYAGDMDKLAVRSALPKLHALEQRHGSLMLGAMRQAKEKRAALRLAAPAGAPVGKVSPKVSIEAGPSGRRLFGFRAGLSQLPEALAAAFERAGGKIRLGAAAAGLRREGKQGYRVSLPDGDVVADDVVVTLPPPAAAALLGPLDTELAAAYASIPMASIAALSLAFDRAAVPHPLDGFGFLAPRRSGLPVLGSIFMSSALPGFAQAPEGQVVLRVMIGGARDPGAAARSEAELVGQAREALGAALGIQAAPVFSHVQRWAQAIEQYHRGHADRVAVIEARTRAHGLFACGAALHGVSVPDVLQDGQRAAAAVLAHA